MKYCCCDGVLFGHLQILPTLQAEKFCSPGWATGLMRNWAFALQVLASNGQHGGF